jgi:hypothetical protein
MWACACVADACALELCGAVEVVRPLRALHVLGHGVNLLLQRLRTRTSRKQERRKRERVRKRAPMERRGGLCVPGWRPAWRARPPTGASARPAGCAAPTARRGSSTQHARTRSSVHSCTCERERVLSQSKQPPRAPAARPVSPAETWRTCPWRRCVGPDHDGVSSYEHAKAWAQRIPARCVNAPRARQAEALHLQLQHGAVNLIQRL